MPDRKRAFSIMELMVAVTILTVVVSMASVGYTQYRDRAAMLVDETNQKVLLAAVKLYAYDTNALPGSLSQLRPRDVERAYAQVTDGKTPYTFFAFLQEQVGLCNIAEAIMSPSVLSERYIAGGNATPEQRLNIFTCPIDDTKPTLSGGNVITGYSYGFHAQCLNPDGTGKPLSWLLDPANATAVCIVESEEANPSSTAQFARRHRTGYYVQITVGGITSQRH